MQQYGMRRFVICEEDGRPSLQEGETFDYELGGVKLFFRPTDDFGSGNLYVTSRRIIWLGSANGFDFDVPYISLHAVSKDPESFHSPCLYCQFDMDDIQQLNENDDSENSETDPTEMFLVPSDEDFLTALFEAFSKAALLNPDPDDEENEGEGDFIYNTDEVELGAEQARMLAHFESVFNFPGSAGENLNGQDSQFDDAEDEQDVAEEVGDGDNNGMEVDATRDTDENPHPKQDGTDK